MFVIYKRGLMKYSGKFGYFLKIVVSLWTIFRVKKRNSGQNVTASL